MDFSQIRHPYPSRRSVTYGRRGMVATSQTLAAQAGLAMLKQGGNAADAIIATAIAMTVLEPTSNGLGSDAFALYWSAKDHQLFGLNGSGWAPLALAIWSVFKITQRPCAFLLKATAKAITAVRLLGLSMTFPKRRAAIFAQKTWLPMKRNG